MGFLGKEYTAITEFFNFYKLRPPITPLLQSEFRNPLFLHIVCSSLSGFGFDSIPEGKSGFFGILRFCLEYKNKVISDICDIDPNQNNIQVALTNIASKMFDHKTKHLEYNIAKEICENVVGSHSYQTSLLCNLEKEGLISFFTRRDDPLEEKRTFCRFTFERISDFLIAESILNSISSEEDIYVILADEWISDDKGLLEALSIIIPETGDYSEILDYCNFENNLLIESFISGIEWREKSSISDRTIYWFEKLLNSRNGEVVQKLFRTLISLSIIPENILNAKYLNNLLLRRELCNRDAFWTYFLIEEFETNQSVWTIIEWACHAELDNFSRESKFLWLVILCWFTSCSDRRIRDKSSKGIVRLLCSDLLNCKKLLVLFFEIDDDFILERIVQAVYSTLLLDKSKTYISEIASYIIENNLISKHDNVLINEGLRLIIELSYTTNCLDISEIRVEEIRKTCSGRKFKIYEEEQCIDILKSDAFKNSNIDMLTNNGLGSDFKRYKLIPRLRLFDIENSDITHEDIYRWFIVELYNLGYPGNNELCWKFDRYLMGKHGNGRAKPVWAERLSKKYYWILLNRLLGILKNTIEYKQSVYSDVTEPLHPRLVSLDVRKIDLTDLRYNHQEEVVRNIQTPTIIIEKNENPPTWLVSEKYFSDIPCIICSSKDETGKTWIPLVFYDSHKEGISSKEYPYKEKAVQFSSILMKKEDFTNSNDLLHKQILYSDIFEVITNDYKIYLGEYPYTRPCREMIETNYWPQEYELGNNNKYIPTALELLRGGEWEYDCSFNSETIIVPSPFIIEKECLKWDRKNSWLDINENLVIISAKTTNGRVLWFEQNFLNNFLCDELILIFTSYNEKMYVEEEFSAARGLHSKRNSYSYDGMTLNDLYEITQECDYRD